MTTTTRSVVDSFGNIHVHSQVGVKISILDQAENGTPISLAGKIWRFSTPKFNKILPVDPTNPAGLELVVTPAEAAMLSPDVTTPFLVTDETGEERWSGAIRRRGW